jgi:hypothetical protein
MALTFAYYVGKNLARKYESLAFAGSTLHMTFQAVLDFLDLIILKGHMKA